MGMMNSQQAWPHRAQRTSQNSLLTKQGRSADLTGQNLTGQWCPVQVWESHGGSDLLLLDFWLRPICWAHLGDWDGWSSLLSLSLHLLHPK